MRLIKLFSITYLKMKVLITGGTSGFGKEIVDFFGHGSLGLGRGNDWALQDIYTHEKIAEKSLEYDIFINYAFLSGEIQLSILQKVFEKWLENDKTGLIVNFGTINTYYQRTTLNKYAIQKAMVDEACRQMSKVCLSGGASFSLTNLRLGYLNMLKNIGKKYYTGSGISSTQIGQCITQIYKAQGLTYPEVIIDSNQPYAK